ncbi:MAG: aldehyde dehydrogenase family protein [Anaerolineales bacterium]|nr:aldehyde dehydrogenase family protein [Anaerolineales bacterium]
MTSARKGFEHWSSLPPYDRERILLKCADHVEANYDRLLNLLIDESGSSIIKAKYEVLYTASVLRTAAGRGAAYVCGHIAERKSRTVCRWLSANPWEWCWQYRRSMRRWYCWRR